VGFNTYEHLYNLYSLNMDDLSSQCKTNFKGPRHAMAQYHMVLLGYSDTIYNDSGKTLDISALSLQKDKSSYN
jgi:hypothetical protein